jgi:hypothetical protein
MPSGKDLVVMKPGPRCFYCTDDKVSISVCLRCRTKMEMFKMELERALKQAESYRIGYYRLLNEKKRTVRKGSGKNK